MNKKLLVCMIASICLIGLAVGVEMSNFDWFKMYEETAINNTYLNYRIIDLQNQVEHYKGKPCNCGGAVEKLVYIQPTETKHHIRDYNKDGVIDSNDYDIFDRCKVSPDRAECYI